MSVPCDRNLLFGILALQMDFITREQLIAGMQAWVLAKDSPLAEHLERDGFLRPENRRLLEPLVAAHIKQHADDPQKSLASISSMESVRAELAQLADPQLDASLACVPAAAGRFDPQATLSVAMGEPNVSGPRFRILRPHAEGGLGRVYVARDEELGREVALKEIKPEKARNPDNRTRFAREAEITGGLEHPGIVPVYGLGSYPDGRPYYAMRFIRGHSLKEAIEQFHRPPEAGEPGPSASERNLQLRRLLQRLIDVCEAIDYAHSRGVLHRDLKPGNIMLGRYGETLVVDWGLAKAMGQAPSSETTHGGGTDNTVERTYSAEAPLVPLADGSSEPTMLGTTIGTPAFMSPEQAAARFDLLGPASDVFSLGATLYQVLTGKPPYEGPNALRQAESGDFHRPRTIKRQIPGPLEAICLKAMATRPKERYSSTRELARDLERYLADEHVLAHEESPAERLSRWSRRHKTWVRAAVAALVVLSLGATGAAVLINGARHRAVAAEQTAKTNEGKALQSAAAERAAKERERVEREKAERLAEENHRIAVQRTQLAQQKGVLADFLVGSFQASDPVGLGGVPFFIPKSDDEELKATDILIRGVERLQTDEELKEQPLARAAIMDAIGDVYRQLGDFEKARPLLTEALATRRRELPANDPDLATSCYHLGWCYHETGDYDRARPLYDEALAIRRGNLSALTRAQMSDEGRRLTAAVLRNLGWMLAEAGEGKEADEFFRQALQLQASPDGRANREAAMTKFGLAFSLIEQGRKQDALVVVLDARREWTRAGGNPKLTAAATAFGLGVILRDLADRSPWLGPWMLAESERQLRGALTTFARVAGDEHYITGVMHFELARSLESLKKFDEADAEFLRAMEIGKKRGLFQHPKVRVFAYAYSNYLKDRGRPREGTRIWDDYVAAQQRRFGPDHLNVALSCWQQGKYLDSIDDYPASIRAHDECIRICRLPGFSETWLLGVSLADRGYSRMRQGSDLAAAEADLREGLEILDDLVAQGEDQQFSQVFAMADLANVMARRGRAVEASAHFVAAREAAERYPKEFANRHEVRNYVLSRHADFLLDRGLPAEAAETSLLRKQVSRGSPIKLYEIAGELGRAAALWQNMPNLTDEQQLLASAHRQAAIVTLRQAVEAGYSNKAAILRNSWFESLRADEDFQTILNRMR